MMLFDDIVKDKDVVIFDVYGVIKFSKGFSPSVLYTMERLRKEHKRVILLTNASSVVTDIIHRYAKNNMFRGVHYDEVMTSGQFAYEVIQRGELPVCGKKYYVFGTANFQRPDDKVPDLFKNSSYEVTDDLNNADFVYCGVPQINLEDRLLIDDFLPLLEKIQIRKLPMLSANLDLRANEDGQFVVRQGLICKKFEEMGGKTILFGKPNPKIFDSILENMPLINREKVLMVGDTLITDILGANLAHIKSCLVIEGGITEYTLLSHGKDVNLETIQQFIKEQKVFPDYICQRVTNYSLF